jgi:hypothetical protein
MTRKRLRMARSINQAVSVLQHLNAPEPMTSKMKKLLIVVGLLIAIKPPAKGLENSVL